MKIRNGYVGWHIEFGSKDYFIPHWTPIHIGLFLLILYTLYTK